MAGRHASLIRSWSRQLARRSCNVGCCASASGKHWMTTATAGADAAAAVGNNGLTSRRLFSAPLCTLGLVSGWSELRRLYYGGGIHHRSYSTGQKIPGGPSGSVPEEFGNLTAQSVVTDDVLDSLIALKDFGNIQGLPPLDVILDEDVEADKKAKRRELDRKKQLEIDSKRVKTVDEQGRAYATGRRKASTARVWLREGEGKIAINGKPHDLYFPDIDQRLQLLEPFWETNQLGVFDVRATVKGGGVSGQSGALRHGISKALQLYDPTLRPTLKSAGMLTRDSRVVERKKPGKAKARKSFQWVKR